MIPYGSSPLIYQALDFMWLMPFFVGKIFLDTVDIGPVRHTVMRLVGTDHCTETLEKNPDYVSPTKPDFGSMDFLGLMGESLNIRFREIQLDRARALLRRFGGCTL